MAYLDPQTLGREDYVPHHVPRVVPLLPCVVPPVPCVVPLVPRVVPLLPCVVPPVPWHPTTMYRTMYQPSVAVGAAARRAEEPTRSIGVILLGY